MPEFIGADKRQGTIEVSEPPEDYVRVTYSQQRLFPAEVVRVVLDTSDRGGLGSYAKRWWQWYVPRSLITETSTEALQRRAVL